MLSKIFFFHFFNAILHIQSILKVHCKVRFFFFFSPVAFGLIPSSLSSRLIEGQQLAFGCQSVSHHTKARLIEISSAPSCVRNLCRCYRNTEIFERATVFRFYFDAVDLMRKHKVLRKCRFSCLKKAQFLSFASIALP